MTDLFGNEDPVQTSKAVVYQKVTTQNHDIKAEIVPIGVKTDGYDFSQIRRKFYDGKWHFVYMDVISALTGSIAPKKYAAKLKKQLIDEGFEWSTKCRLLTLKAVDGKSYRTSCFAQEDILRIIEEIPSPKAEPLKREIARLAKERLEEIQNPEKGIENSIKRWEQMGKDKPWIEARMKGITIRKQETSALQSHGISAPEDFAHFTDRTNLAVYGHKAKTEKALKKVGKGGNLRDGSTQTELILLSLHEDSCAWGIESSNAFGRAQIDGVYDIVGGIVSSTKYALDCAFGKR